MKVECFGVGPIYTNCYFATNEETKELLVIDPGRFSGAFAGPCERQG